MSLQCLIQTSKTFTNGQIKFLKTTIRHACTSTNTSESANKPRREGRLVTRKKKKKVMYAHVDNVLGTFMRDLRDMNLVMLPSDEIPNINTHAICPVDYGETSMKQSVGKCKQINFLNLCVISILYLINSYSASHDN